MYPTGDRKPVPGVVAWSDSRITGFVVISAMFHAARRIAEELKLILRSTVLACVAAGAEVRGGFRLYITQSERRPFQRKRECDHHFREAVLHRMTRLNGTLVDADTVAAAHGRWSHTLKWVCDSPPGPRYAWQGPFRKTAGVAADGDGDGNDDKDGISDGKDNNDIILRRLRDVGDRIVRLAAATPSIKRMFGNDHPLIGSEDTADIMGLMWNRFAGIETETRAVLSGLDAAIRRRTGESVSSTSMSVLNAAALRARTQVQSGQMAAGGAVPEPLLTGYAAVATDLQFLSRVEAMHRSRLIPLLTSDRGALESNGRMRPQRWDSGPLPDDCHLPDVGCRLTSRRIMNWKRLYALRWPEAFAIEEREWEKQSQQQERIKKNADEKGTEEDAHHPIRRRVYTSRIEFVGS
jgi:hypothetical protein